MKKRIFGMLLMGAMVIASVSMFTSCKDYDDDINKLQSQIDAITAQNLQTQLTSLQTALTAAQTAADAAKSAAAQAATAAQAAQTTADSKASAGDAEAAKAAAEAAQAAADAAQATADAAAKAQTEYKDGKKRTTGVETKNKSRDYSKEKAICNLQYIDPAYGDQEITGLANNRVRFTILPKPLVHIPNLAEGEPPWRFKRMLFDADGNYDPNGKYTINVEDDDKLAYLDEAITIDPRNGEVHINDKDKVMKNLVECYPGLTVYEFNYDYVMGMKLFDAKVMATTLLDTLVNTRLGLNLNLAQKHQEATEEIKEIIKNIINSDDSEVEANIFASYLIMTYEGLERYAKTNNLTEWTLEEIIRAEQYFQISHHAMLFRLREHEFISLEKCKELRSVQIGYNAKINGFSDDLYTPSSKSEKYFSLGKYIRLVEKVFNDNKISSGKRDELLLDAFRSDLTYKFF